MSMVLFFSMAYVALNENSKNSNHLLGLAAISSTLGYLCLRFQDNETFTIGSYLKDLQHVSIFLFYSFSFSPVLYKLTDTISSKWNKIINLAGHIHCKDLEFKKQKKGNYSSKMPSKSSRN